MKQINCQACGEPIGAGDHVFRLKVVRPPHGHRKHYGTTYLPHCFDCGFKNLIGHATSQRAKARAADALGLDVLLAAIEDDSIGQKDILLALYDPTECERCGRVVILPRGDHRVAPVCHPDCNGQQGAVCPTCDDTFTPARTDAKYCSNACRQKAYRNRKSQEEESCTNCGQQIPDDGLTARARQRQEAESLLRRAQEEEEGGSK